MSSPYHVLWPEASPGLSTLSASIEVAAAVALFRFLRNVIHVIAARAALGPIAKFLPA